MPQQLNNYRPAKLRDDSDRLYTLGARDKRPTLSLHSSRFHVPQFRYDTKVRVEFTGDVLDRRYTVKPKLWKIDIKAFEKENRLFRCKYCTVCNLNTDNITLYDSW